MSDADRHLVNRMIEEIQNRKRIEVVDEIFSENFLNHTPPRGYSSDRDGMRQLFAMMNVAFPDGGIRVDDQVSSAGKVWTRKTFSGTHTGALGSYAPTGNKVTYTVVDILEVRRGEIVEHWSLLDQLSLLRQLGVLKA